ncbi:MAG: MCP four helix bundle domain-containing protein [Bacteroidota bacterium]
MKFAHTIKQKTTIALLLFGVMACTILIRILEDKSIKEMNKAFISMYNDRLIPATDLFYLAENLYAKRYLLESIIDTEPLSADKQEVLKRLASHNSNIATLLNKYEKTFLTVQEKKYLTELKAQLKANSLLEDQLIKNQATQTPQQNKAQFEKLGSPAFNEIVKKLTALTQIQSKVGEELIKDSKYLVSGSNLYSNIQFALAIIIGILIVAIIFAANVVNVKQQKFNLN